MATTWLAGSWSNSVLAAFKQTQNQAKKILAGISGFESVIQITSLSLVIAQPTAATPQFGLAGWNGRLD